MRRIGMIALVLALSVSVIAAEKKPRGKDAKVKSVILIGWDGAQRNHLKEALGRAELPNLKKLSSQGSLVAIDVLRTTDTKAGWSQILTGYEPEVTGVFSNSIFQSIPEDYTVFERLEKYFGPENIATVAVIGKTGHVGNAPSRKQRIPEQQGRRANRPNPQQVGNIVEEDGVKYRVIPDEPFYNASKNMDVFINGLGSDVNVGTKTIELLDKYKDKPFFFFVHFAEVDQKGHAFGENSEEYNDALKSGDLWTGRIVEKLKELKIYDKALIYIVAEMRKTKLLSQ